MKFKNFSITILCFSFTPTHAELNDTGIITCSNANQNGLSCPVASFPDQDAEYGTNAFDFTKLDANGNTLLPTVTNHTCVKDNITGLIWEVKTNDNGLRDKDWTYTWYSSTAGGTSNGGTCYTPGRCDTEKFVADVNTRGLCGYNDWRLPNPQEFVSIVDYSITEPDPTIDTRYFPNTLPEWSWTSQQYAGSSNQAWIVSFYSGIVYNKDRALKIPVRLVRGEQMPIASFIFSNNNATITDQATGLMWAKCAIGQNANDCSGNATDVSWETALNMSGNSTLAGYSDWRLPNIKELQSLIDYTKYNPSINSSFFPNTPNAASAKFWASSPGASAVSGNFVYSWGITFYDGNINAFDRSGDNGNSYAVLLVRDNNEQLFPLSITKTGSGTGTVTSDPVGINCGNDCSEIYSSDTNVTLTAAPATGSMFSGWSGECSGSINTCSIFMDATKNAAAIFDLISLPIAITNDATNITKTSVTLNGSIISAGAMATVNFRLGTTVDYGTDIIATPSQIYSSSAVSVSANKTGLTCNTDYNFCVKAVSSAGTSNCRNKIFKTATCINYYTVTALAGNGGTIANGTVQTVNYATTANFIVTANSGYETNTAVSGTCPQGTWNANVWTTGAITTNCTVNFSFTLIPQVDGICGTANNGTFGTAPTVDLCFSGTAGDVTNSNGSWNWICNGLNGGLSNNCSATIKYTVTPNIGNNGSVSPSTPQLVNPDTLKSFTVTPNVGYIKNFVVDGDCPPGSWNENNKWTTGPIKANCSVNFSFIEQPTAWLSPTNPYVTVGTNLPIELHVDTFGGQVASYTFDIKFDQSKLLVKTDYAGTGCQQGVCPGANALSNISATPDNSMGKINLIGFDTQGGVGPSNNLHLVTIHFITRQTLVTTPIELSLISMRSIIGDSIGNGLTGNSLVNIQRYKCGDSNGDSFINIIDALAIARQVIGLPPPPSITPVADVSGNDDISIVDAMHIARYSLGLVVVGTCLM